MESERDIENKYAKQLYVWRRGILGLKGGVKPPDEVIDYLNKEIPDWQEYDCGRFGNKNGRVCANECSNVNVKVKDGQYLKNRLDPHRPLDRKTCKNG